MFQLSSLALLVLLLQFCSTLQLRLPRRKRRPCSHEPHDLLNFCYLSSRERKHKTSWLAVVSHKPTNHNSPDIRFKVFSYDVQLRWLHDVLKELSFWTKYDARQAAMRKPDVNYWQHNFLPNAINKLPDFCSETHFWVHLRLFFYLENESIRRILMCVMQLKVEAFIYKKHWRVKHQ